MYRSRILILLLPFLLVIFQAAAETSPTHVDLTTGQYVETNSDLILPGPVPFCITRRSTPAEGDHEYPLGSAWHFEIEAFREKTPVGQPELVIDTDASNRLKKVALLAAGTKRELEWATFEYKGGSLTITTHDGQVWNYAFDASGQLTSVTSPAERQIEYQYESGCLTERKAAHATTTMRYENGKVVSQTLQSAGNECTSTFTFEYQNDQIKMTTPTGVEKVSRIDPVTKQVQSIDVYAEGRLQQRELFYWQIHPELQEPTLISTALLNGKLKPLHCRTYAYDEKGHLIRETLWGNLSGTSRTPIYLDKNGTPLSNGVESFSKGTRYNSLGLIEEEFDDAGRKKRYFYHPDSELLESTRESRGDEELIESTHSYNHEGLLTEITTTNLQTNETVTFTMTLSEEAHSAGLPALIEMSKNGVPEKSIQRLFGSHGKPTQEVTIDLLTSKETTLYKEYDADGLEEYISDDSGPRLLLRRKSANEIVEIDYQKAEVATSTFDHFGNITYKSLLREGQIELEQTNTYDGGGNLIETRDVLDNLTLYERDALGRVTKKTDPPVLDKDEQLVTYTTTYIYDDFGQLKELVNPIGEVTTFAYNSRGQPTFVKYSDGTTETMVYDLSGKLKSRIDRDGRELQAEEEEKEEAPESTSKTPPPLPTLDEEFIEHLTYDETNSLGQRCLKKLRHHVDGSTWVTTYDALGRVEAIELKSAFDQLLFKRECRYDGLNRLVKERLYHFDRAHSDGYQTTEWFFGKNGKLEKMLETDSDGTTKSSLFKYNSQNLITHYTKPSGVQIISEYDDHKLLTRTYASDQSFDYEYHYDEAGRLLSSVDLHYGVSFTRIYDEAGNLLSETTSFNTTIENRYNENGERAELILPDQSWIAYEYNDEGRMQWLQRFSASGDLLFDYFVEKFCPWGYIEKERLPFGLGQLKTSRNYNFQLDSRTCSYFTEAFSYYGTKISSYSRSGGGVQEENEYDYDNLGQLFRENGTIYNFDSHFQLSQKKGESATYGPFSELVEYEGKQFAYDQDGNCIKEKGKDLTKEFTYDGLSRLRSVTIDAERVEYFYDGLSRRKLEKRYERVDHNWKETSTREFIYDQSIEIGAMNALGEMEELRILTSNGRADIGAMVAVELNGKSYATLSDYRGNVIQLVDAATKKAVESYSYSSFGEERCFDAKGKPLEKATLPWRFSSKRVDSLSGLVHFGRRDYQPAVMRFLTPDPLGKIDSPNPYAFVRNDPINRIDPSGLLSTSTLWDIFHFIESFLYHHMEESRRRVYSAIQPTEEFLHQLSKFNAHVFGTLILVTLGFNDDPSEVGVYGSGELHDKYRISFINGILTSRPALIRNVDTISKAHGGCNVHYCYVGTRGFASDILRAVCVKFGYTSPEAVALSAVWKKLINELGGPGSEGLIFHFAHSLGGTETLRARHLLSSEEQRMICVITFGSPSLIPEDGFYGVINIISYRDFSYIFDPIAFIFAIISSNSNVFFVGSPWDGVPLIDHLFDSYWGHWIEQFWDGITNIFDSFF